MTSLNDVIEELKKQQPPEVKPVLEPGHYLEFYEKYWSKPLPTSKSMNGLEYWTLPPQTMTSRTDHRLIILPEYIPMKERILAVVKEQDAGILLTGNPGIGKSYFLNFLLIHFLNLGQPVVVYDGDGIFIYYEQGVLQVANPSTFRFSSPAYKRIPALIDSDVELRPPNCLVNKNSSLFPIHAASPRPERYDTWTKQRLPRTLIMNPWPVDKICTALLHVHKYRSDDLRPDTEIIVKACDRFGRNVRALFDMLDEPNGMLKYDRQLNNVIIPELDMDVIRKLIMSPENTPRSITHKIITTFRLDEFPEPSERLYTSSDTTKHTIISRYIWKMLYNRMAKLTLKERRKLFDLMTASSSFSVSRGWLFESMCHDRLVLGGNFQIIRMVQKDERFVKGTVVEDLEVSQREMETYPAAMAVASTASVEKYYVPAEGNNPTFDSFMHDDKGTGCQMTVGRKHDLVEPGLSLLNGRLRHLSTKKHRFVFVIPKGYDFSCPLPSSHWLRRFEFYTLEMDFGTDFHAYWEVDKDEDDQTERASDMLPDEIDAEEGEEVPGPSARANLKRKRPSVASSDINDAGPVEKRRRSKRIAESSSAGGNREEKDMSTGKGVQGRSRKRR